MRPNDGSSDHSVAVTRELLTRHGYQSPSALTLRSLMHMLAATVLRYVTISQNEAI
jgi:hypothetical protein